MGLDTRTPPRQREGYWPYIAITWLSIIYRFILMPHTGTAQPLPLAPITIEDQQLHDAEHIRDTPTFATSLTTDDATSRVDSVTDVLAQSVGVQMRRFGGLGSFSTVSIRGSTPNQVEVYLDGVRLNAAQAGFVDVGNIPLDNVARIDVYRGFAPLQLGAGSIGGAINLVTRQVSGQTLNRASASYGSFDTRKLTLYRSQGFDALGYLVLFNYAESDGDFEFLDDNGTPLNARDDERTRRTNNDFKSFNLHGKGEASVAGWTLKLTDDFFTKDKGINGRANVQAEARLDSDRNVITLQAQRPGFLHPALDLNLHLSHTWQRDAFKDLRGNTGVGFRDEESTNHTWSAQGLLNLYLDDWNQVAGLMVEGRYETFRTLDKLPELRGNPADRGPLQRRTSLILAGQHEWRLFDDRLALQALLRYQYTNSRFGRQLSFRNIPIEIDPNDDAHLFSPSLGIKFSLTSVLDLKANIGRFQRLPTLFELFGNRGASLGNPGLKSETSINWDLGAVFQLPRYGILDRVFIEAAYFASRSDDLILFVQNSQVSARAENIGSADINGIEMSWSVTAFGHLRVFGNYTFQIAKDTSATFSRGNTLLGRPRHELHQGLEGFTDYGKVTYELDYLSSNFLDRSNLTPVDARLLHNLRFTLTPWSDRLTITLELKNLTDNQIGDFRGFPLPGRSIFGTVEGRF